MPRPSNVVPTYRLHRSSGQVVVTVCTGGVPRDVYLGPYNSADSRLAYARVCAGLAAIAPGTAAPTTATAKRPAAPRTVAVVLAAYLNHAVRYYCHSDGRPHV